MNGSFEIIEGSPEPLGLSFSETHANFALFSSHATRVTLGFFIHQDPIIEIPMNRTDNIWHIGIVDLPKGLEYAYRCEGPSGYLFNPKYWLLDPYAKIIHGDRARAKDPNHFDWENDMPPNIPKEDLIIYEMHVRGLTRHPSSKVNYPGTYLGMIEKIPYLKKLGINAVELLPIFDFDETVDKHISPKTKQKLVNYWGYNPLNFFAPMDWYAIEDPVDEFKTLVKELHKNGIEVILDVVYNHSGEGKETFYYKSFRGIDNPVYYMLDAQGKYLNYSGCGNTLNVNHPIVQKLIIDSLRYWVEQMHVDGFRFDLASILTRDLKGKPLAHPPILEMIAKDPILSKVKLIAEAWDAAGLYQLGYFPRFGRFSEWNGRYRDVVRRFIKGTNNYAGHFANVMMGTETIYRTSKTPLSSINFITAHDGFCLKDLVTYQEKHNFDNGENNRDGSNQNDSWNCGFEGETDDPNINAFRQRQLQNFLLALFLAQGIPMLLMGDEMGHTRKGNNNPYVQDNEINWHLWDQINPKIFDFTSALIAFRKKNPALRSKTFLTDKDVSWHNSWNSECRYVAFELKNQTPHIFAAFNANYLPTTVGLPEGSWRQIVNTTDDWVFNENGPIISSVPLPGYAALLAIKI